MGHMLEFTIHHPSLICFSIEKPPIPQKQTRFVMRGKYPRAYDPSKEDLNEIKWQAQFHAPKEPFTGPIDLDISFYLPIPKSTSGIKSRQMKANIIKHIKKPDIDNLAYLVTNALKGIIYADDSQIVKQTCSKFYSDTPRTIIKVIDINSFFINPSNKV